MVKIRFGTLSNIKICLQNAHEKIDFLQLESKFQQEELHQNRHHYEHVIVQNIETDTHQQQVNIVQAPSDLVPNEAVVVHADAEVQFTLPKPIIRPLEGLVLNKHKTGLGYDKEVSFHIPIYSKPIQFQSVGFLHDSSPSTVPDSTPLP